MSQTFLGMLFISISIGFLGGPAYGFLAFGVCTLFVEVTNAILRTMVSMNAAKIKAQGNK